MYAIYLRKSRADKELDVKEDVLLRHENSLLELAESRNYTIGKIYREIVSGETLAARPQMQLLLSEVENGLWEGVLCMEVERLARGNTIDQGIVSQAFKLSNTLIITPAKIYNPANEFDEEYFEFGLFMSRREYKTINRRLSAGRLASCREGKYVGSTPPYGFDKLKLKGQKGYKLVTIPHEIEVVKLIYSLYLSNEIKTGLQGIANRLNDTEVPTRTGKLWTAVQIKNILTNDVYIGKIHWQKTPEVKKSKNGAIIKTRENTENYYVFDGLHDAVIDTDTYNSVQKIISSRKKAPLNTNLPMQNPFAGILICSLCGKPLKRRPVDKRRPGHSPSYDCITKGCPVVGCPVSILEERILIGIEQFLSNYRLELKNSAPLKPVTFETRITIFNKKLENLKKQLTNTFTLLEQGLYDKDTFLNRQAAIKEEISNILNTLNTLGQENKLAKERADHISLLVPQFKSLIEIWNILPDAKTKNELIKALFHQILYKKITRGNRWNKELIDDFEIEFISKLPNN